MPKDILSQEYKAQSAVKQRLAGNTSIKSKVVFYTQKVRHTRIVAVVDAVDCTR
jgi:hypothetical protein